MTVADAAKYLASVFVEEVSEADVLRFALDGEIKLSVNFVNETVARPGVLIPIDSAPYKEVEFPLSPEPIRIYGGPKILTDGIVSHVLNLDTGIGYLRGVYDLPMIGGEQMDVEHRFQMLIGGPAVTSVAMDGAFVESADGRLCQLLDDYDDNQFSAGSRAQLKNIERRIAAENIDTGEAEKLLNKHKADRLIFLADRKQKPVEEHYYPGGGLPADSVMVVRTAALTEFIDNFNADSDQVGRSLGTTERRVLLCIIAALAKEAKLDVSKPGKTAIFIESLTDALGVHVAKRTIEEHLKRIPDALESRMK